MKEKLREGEDRMKRFGQEEKMVKRFLEVNKDMRFQNKEVDIVLSTINRNKFIFKFIGIL